jgi:hypothetical protein
MKLYIKSYMKFYMESYIESYIKSYMKSFSDGPKSIVQVVHEILFVESTHTDSD